jgi:hypothetical protein
MRKKRGSAPWREWLAILKQREETKTAKVVKTVKQAKAEDKAMLVRAQARFEQDKIAADQTFELVYQEYLTLGETSIQAKAEATKTYKLMMTTANARLQEAIDEFQHERLTGNRRRRQIQGKPRAGV